MSRLRAIALCGSPRSGGNTELMLRRCLDRLEAQGAETELVRLSERRVEPCRACGGCRALKDGTCAQGGDDFQEVFEAMRRADVIIAGSPVYFGSATPQIMALLDRAGYVSRVNGNLLSRKMGGPVVVARRAGQNFTFAQLSLWYAINDMVMAGASYWNVGFGSAAGEVEKDAEAMATLDRFAENLGWLGERLRN